MDVNKQKIGMDWIYRNMVTWTSTMAAYKEMYHVNQLTENMIIKE